MDLTTILLIIFGVLSLILSAASIALLLSVKKRDNTMEISSGVRSAVSDEFRLSRAESAESARIGREELTSALDGIGKKLAEQTKENYDSRLELTEKISKSLENIRQNNIEQNERQSRIIQESVVKLQESNEKKLDQMRATVDEKLTATLGERLNASFKTVSEQLENVYKSLGEMKELSAGVTTNVTSLNRVLTNVKARGTWAEVQLESILDQTIPGMYVKNFSPKDNTERVEFAVIIPASEKDASDTYLPIDSKFPMEDYVRLCSAADAADAAELQSARKALEDRVMAEAKDVAKYIVVPKTTPFAILYLATEGLYAEIASSRSGLYEKLQKENIMIAGPTTVTALLNSLAMGFKTIAINEKANEVRVLLAAAKSQYDTFGITLQKARKKIDEAGKSLDDAQKRNSIIQKKLKGVEALSGQEATEILGIEEYDAEDGQAEE